MAKDGKKRKAQSAGKRGGSSESLPAVLAPDFAAPLIETEHGSFDLDDPGLPGWVEDRAFSSGGFPYRDHLDGEAYEAALRDLQVELVKLQRYMLKTGRRLVVLFEGRDAAGKGGAIFVFSNYLNPRAARNVALAKPSEAERGQWYFQRYVSHLPTAGEIVLFDRSWYNRAGVESVMGFCTEAERRVFLKAVPRFEKMLVDEGTTLFKFWMEIGQEMQLKRFHERRHDPLKIWKLSPIDYGAMQKWDEYTAARDEMLTATHNPIAPWTVALANDKRRVRLAIIRCVLGAIDYAGKDDRIVGKADRLILGPPALLKSGG